VGTDGNIFVNLSRESIARVNPLHAQNQALMPLSAIPDFNSEAKFVVETRVEVIAREDSD
jgi:hypothetical protein